MTPDGWFTVALEGARTRFMKNPEAEVAAAIFPSIEGILAEFRPLYSDCGQNLTLAIALVGRTWTSLPYVCQVGFAKRIIERIEKEHSRAAQCSLPEAEEQPEVRSQELRRGRGRRLGAQRRKIDGVRFG